MNNNNNNITHSGQQESNRIKEEGTTTPRTEVSKKENTKDQPSGKNVVAADRPRKSFHNDGPGGNYKGY
ncbi:MAG TPA: hypothetical protein VJ499_01695 [Flavisolibacter sp.]|nr:hypothetical protein [Flavisolibacter sp.]